MAQGLPRAGLCLVNIMLLTHQKQVIALLGFNCLQAGPLLQY